MEVGDKVKYTVGDMDYFGIIISADNSNSRKVIYSVSIFALGTVIKTDGTKTGGGKLVVLND